APGPASPAATARATGVAKAAALLRADHYGWFERISRGLYGLTPRGQAALGEYRTVLTTLHAA
ncbi:MAG: hypothetical protein HC844_21135, partial [Tabrizicola sp.]|nr:hypothetical protein [Tabrizicola sp.]